MEGFLVIVYIIMLVWGILNIILFFKVWGMTNDIRQIKDIIYNNSSTDKNNSGVTVSDNQEKVLNNDDNPIELVPGDKVVNKYTNETVIISQVLSKDFVECESETGKKLGKFNKEYFTKKG